MRSLLSVLLLTFSCTSPVPTVKNSSDTMKSDWCFKAWATTPEKVIAGNQFCTDHLPTCRRVQRATSSYGGRFSVIKVTKCSRGE